VYPLRAAAGRLPQVQPVPDLLPHDGAPRRTARHHQVQLVTTENEHTAGPAPAGNRGEEGLKAMTMTDPIADMLTRLRNANSAYHDTVGMPYSKIKSRIAEILQQEGYIAGWRVEDAEVGRNLVIILKFGNQRERSIAGIKRVSKPGLRVYAKKDNLPKVLGGLGVAIISTSGGLLTDKQANKRGVGGEVLAYVW
jgi:small subunit ribosomal protein S8